MNGVCENDETISSRFESMASIKFDFRVDAQNGAFGGFSPAQYARVILYKGVPINPDIVVVGIYTGNDFFDLLRKDDRPWVKLIDDKLVWQEPDWVTLKDPDFKKSTLNQSRIYWIGYELFNRTVGYTYSRAQYLFDSAPEQASLTSVWKFLNVIRKGESSERTGGIRF